MSHAVAVAAGKKNMHASAGSEIHHLATSAAQASALAVLAADHPNAKTALATYLTTLAACFDQFALSELRSGLLDGKVLTAIERFTPYLDEYRSIMTAAAARNDAGELTCEFVAFFAALKKFKQAPVGGQQSAMWADSYCFILRELFLTTMAILIRHARYAAAAALLSHRYTSDPNCETTDASFVVFDGYPKSLDELRNRRLQLHRLSVSCDMMRERVDPGHCTFEEIMQADFALCLRSLIREENFFVRWYPRTLVYAERFASAGFDLFVTTAAPGRFEPLAVLLSVADRADLLRRFEDVRDAWCLDQWELGGCPLDFRGYMGLRNAGIAT